MATYTITATITGNGSVSPAMPKIVDEGGSLLVTLTPDSGWEVSDVIIDGTSIGPVTEHYFVYVYSNYNIEVTYTEVSQPTYDVWVEDNIFGIISPGGKLVVDEGSDVGFTILASSGYVFTGWLLDDVLVSTDPTYTLVNVLSDQKIGATFDKVVVYQPSIRLMRSEDITVKRKNERLGEYDSSGYRVEGPDYQAFRISVSKQPGQTQSGMLQAVGEQVRQEGDYDHINKSWKIFSHDKVLRKDRVVFDDEAEDYEVLDVDDWTVSTQLKSVNYRAMVRRIKDRQEIS